MTGVKRPL